jgi:CubicO group peptidase (beta-lactamase class C family)
VVLVARDGKLIYRRAAGFADRESGQPMREDGIFRLASLTKSMVAAAAMRLTEEGKLQLADPVTKWLPDFRPELPLGGSPVITVRHLLTHTSGLTYGFLEPPDHPYHRLGVSDGMDRSRTSLDENLRRLAKAPLSYRPGSAWRYSLSMDVLGSVLEKATGAKLPEVVAARVTRPLGMTSAAFAATDPARLVTPYADGSPSPVRMTDETQVPFRAGAIRFSAGRALDPNAFPSGGAGMVGTAGDFLLFLEAIRRGGAPILAPATVQEMTRDQVGPQAGTQGPGWGFGYGWAVLDDPGPTKTPQTKGTIQWGGAYGLSWFVDVERSLTVIAFTNTALEGMIGRFAIDVRKAAYGD